MKIKLIKPIRVNALSGECEVTAEEYARLLLLGAAEPLIEKKEVPEKVKKETRKTNFS